MESLFLFLRKGLTAGLFVVFAFVFTYVPITHVHQVPTVAAGGVGGSIVFDPTNTAQNAANTVQATLSAAANVFSFNKDNVLDGLAWALAKRTVSGMVTNLIDWVNSDFQGRPAFVTDLGGFLTNIADEEIGNVISELGGLGSFICAPFRLDVQVAVATQYSQSRNGIDGQSAPTCTLSGIIDNIEGFIAGTDPGGGLSDWLRITATPQTYTPYGAVLSAQATARARLINAQGEELEVLRFGAGFLSQSVCEAIEGAPAGQEDCTIVTPGKVVQEALSFNLDSGRQSLVEADEINELIGALFSQLANKAITGINGLLGLSSGNDFSYAEFDGSFLDELRQEGSDSISGGQSSIELISNALRSERTYRNTANLYLDELAEFIADERNPIGERNFAIILNEEIFAEKVKSDDIIDVLTTYLLEFDDADQDRQIEILVAFSGLERTSELNKARNTNDWLRQSAEIDVAINLRDISLLELEANQAGVENGAGNVEEQEL